jgi:hypothetical protein
MAGFLKAARQNKPRHIRYRVRSPPQIFRCVSPLFGVCGYELFCIKKGAVQEVISGSPL